MVVTSYRSLDMKPKLDLELDRKCIFVDTCLTEQNT